MSTRKEHMRMVCQAWKLIVLALLFAFMSRGAQARADAEPKRAEVVKAAVNASALQPGKPATAAVVLVVKDGFHAQSHTPSQPDLIKFTAKLDANPGLTYGPVVFPKGQDYDTKTAQGILNVYEGRVIVRFPVEVKPDAQPGAVTIKGKLHFQICDDNLCYQPVDEPFEIDTAIAAAGAEVKANEPELFDSPAGEAAPPATHPATAPATIAPRPPGAAGGPAPRQYTIIGAFAAAFLVGIIFNVMPCVLPVLPLKAMGFYEASRHNRARSIGYGLAFSLGVIASFAVLGLLVVVKQLFKWGELFSNPWFLGALVIILLLMSLSTFGLFTINLPSSMYGFSPRHDTFFGNVLFGILTAALSTPCTFGMFVGLLTWAIAQPAAEGMGLMLTVGAGMASPYLVLSAFPEAARRFPRTGPWAELVKQMMGFLLLGTAVYFAEPFIEKLVAYQVFWWLLFAVVGVAAVYLVARTLRFSKTAVGPAIAVAIALAMLVPSFLIVRRLTVRRYAWEPYTQQSLATAQASDQVVLVEFTASWCTTCHTLEALVLNNPRTVRCVSDNDVKMIRADLSDDAAPGWTLLRGSLNGQGVPLTVIYPPHSTSPLLLPGLYGVDDLRHAIAEARAKRASPVAGL